MPTYTDDFGNTYENVGFKIKDEYTDSINLGYQPRQTQLCSATGGLFSPRALVATFEFSGIAQKIRFPVPSPEDIADAIEQLLGVAVCLELEGESWSFLPPTRFGYNSANTQYTLPQDSSKESGTFGYSSDVLGAIRAKYASEQEPAAITGVGLGCAEDRQENTVCSTTLTGFKTRRVIAVARNINGGQIVRQFPVTGRATLASCVSSFTNLVACVGYQGESVKNIQVLF